MADPAEIIQEAASDTEVQQSAREGELVSIGDTSSWQSECSDPVSRLSTMLAQGLWLDCELIVGSTMESIQAHKIILASASPVLANMLDHDPCLPIKLRKIELETFKIVLQYIYSNKIDITSCEVACSLYAAAHFLILPQLEVTSKNHLLKEVSAKCVISVYEFAKKFDIKEIVEKCVNEMVLNTEEILMGTELVAARADTLEYMFSLDSLNISSELQLFKAAERWVCARIETTSKKDHAGMGSGDGRNDKLHEKEIAIQSIKNALRKLKFLTLDPAEFSEYDTTSLLTTTEIAAIALNLNSPKTYMPMPFGFSFDISARRSKAYKVVIELENNTYVDVTPLSGDKVKWRMGLQIGYQHEIFVLLYCDINDTPNVLCDSVCGPDVSYDVHLELSMVGSRKKYLLKNGRCTFDDDGLTVSENFHLHDLDSDYIRENKLTIELKVYDIVIKNISLKV